MTLKERFSKEKVMEVTKKLKPCKCGGDVKLLIKEKNEGMDGWSHDFDIFCNKCKGHWFYPADNFYGRDYYTMDELVVIWSGNYHKNHSMDYTGTNEIWV